MRIRKRKNLPKKNMAIVLLFLLPILTFGGLVGILYTIITQVGAWSYDMPAPNTDYFYKEEEIDLNILEQLAHHYDEQLERWHLPPHNITVDVTFTDSSYDEVSYYHGTDNGQLHIAYTLAANCLRYKYALDNGDTVLLENALGVVRKSVAAIRNTFAATNGGIGPDYPGTLARFACPPEAKAYAPFMFEEHVRHFDGVGDYSDWRIRLYTSRDELGGFCLSAASVLKYIDPSVNEDSKWCYETIQLVVAQLIEGFRKTNWLILGGSGEPVGSDINSYLEGSTWQLAVLRLGATAYPDRYMSLYRYACAKILAMGGASMGGVTNAANGYYAFAFGMDVVFALVMLEDNPAIKHHYIQNYEKNFYNIVKFHRNAYFNLCHLVFMTLIDNPSEFDIPNYDNAKIRWDVLDQLWRFHASGWGEGIRNYNLDQRPHSTRSTSLNPLISAKEQNPNQKAVEEFFTTNPFGLMFGDIKDELLTDNFLYKYPLTVSEYETHHFLWEHNKFDGEGGASNGNGLYQAAPNTYILAYWLAKAYNIF